MKFTTFSILAIVSLLAACTTAQINTAVNSPTTHAVISDIAPLVKAYAATGKVDEAQAIAVGLQSISDIAGQQTNSAELKSLISNTVQEFTADPKATIGQKIADVVLDSLPIGATPAQVTSAVVAAGVQASTGANP